MVVVVQNDDAEDKLDDLFPEPATENGGDGTADASGDEPTAKEGGADAAAP